MNYELHLGDCIEHMQDMEPESIDFSIFSPPFPALFAYTDEACDLGNSESFSGDAKLHLMWFTRALAPLIKPGRCVVVHVQNIAAVKRTGDSSTTDLRGLMIRLGKRAGLIYETDWAVTKNPQSQAIRTRSRKLQFAALESDRAQSAPAFSDYLIKFRAPGENKVRITQSGLSRQEWIDWAEGAWSWRDIRETDTLNAKAAKSDDDTRHICPLQLPVINRCIRLYTNPGELVFSPFAGIGSEGYEALRLGRRF
jgi:DNA modification methylase